MASLDELMALEPNDPKVLTLDIETSPNVVYAWGLYDQNIGITQVIEPSRVLCVAAKWLDEPDVMFFSEFHDGRKQMLAEMWRLVDEADIVVGYNHASFDMPHLNREWVSADYGPPSPYQNIDLYRVTRRNFKFASNKLGYKRVYILVPNYPAGKDALEGFKRTFKGSVIGEVFTKLDQNDFAAEIAQIRATNANLGSGRSEIGSAEQAIRTLGDAATARTDEDELFSVGRKRRLKIGRAHV